MSSRNVLYISITVAHDEFYSDLPSPLTLSLSGSYRSRDLEGLFSLLAERRSRRAISNVCDPDHVELINDSTISRFTQSRMAIRLHVVDFLFFGFLGFRTIEYLKFAELNRLIHNLDRSVEPRIATSFADDCDAVVTSNRDSVTLGRRDRSVYRSLLNSTTKDRQCRSLTLFGRHCVFSSRDRSEHRSPRVDVSQPVVGTALISAL